MENASFLEIDVILDQFLGVDERVTMILFHGDAHSDFFNGKVLPGGVDTQTKQENGDWDLSARYILEGEDNEGTPTKIFIQNDGKNINGRMVTRPRIITDNEKLKWIEKEKLEGGISDFPGGVKITLRRI